MTGLCFQLLKMNTVAGLVVLLSVGLVYGLSIEVGINSEFLEAPDSHVSFSKFVELVEDKSDHQYKLTLLNSRVFQ